MSYYHLLICFVCISSIIPVAKARKSSWALMIDETSRNFYTVFPNTMFQGSYISLELICSSHGNYTSPQIQVKWILKELQCMNQLYNTTEIKDAGGVLSELSYEKLVNKSYLRPNPDRVIRDSSMLNNTGSPTSTDSKSNITVLRFMMSQPQVFECGKQNIITLQDESASPYYIGHYDESLPRGHPQQFTWKPVASDWKTISQPEDNRIAKVWETGVYHLLLRIEPHQPNYFKFNTTVIVKMKSKSGYLPAIEWPLLPVRGILALFYLMLGTTWIILWACSHQHTLKIHMMIGAIAIAGALDSTMAFVDYTNKNTTGNGLKGVSWITMFLMVFQTGLMQLLVMVVSTGFGITRPKLTKNILGGAIVLATVSSVINFISNIALDEDLRLKYDHPVLTLCVNGLYAVTTVVVAGWIMVFSVMTFMHLCRRKHSSRKVISFTIFTAACIFTFFGNLVLGLFSLGLTRSCWKDWRMEWLLESYGSMSSLILLAVLMWLWRPVDQAQTYAFTPLGTDELAQPGSDDDDEEEIMMEKVALHPLS